MIKKYSEVIRLETFRDRYEYLKIKSNVGDITFGCDRRVNQLLYTSAKWRSIRNKVIIRDSGCDLAMTGYNIPDKAVIHHINPITLEDVLNNSPIVYDLQNLICVSFETHNAIHFGNDLREVTVITRTPNDMCPWLNNKKRG